MEKNVGRIDRIVRAIFGVAIIFIGIYKKSLWGLIGIIPILSAITGFCLLYRVLGFSTCKTKKE